MLRCRRTAIRAFLVAGISGTPRSVGAGLGWTFLADASAHTLAGLLSFGCAALLFLVTEELLVEAHESADTAVTTTMFCHLFGGGLDR